MSKYYVEEFSFFELGYRFLEFEGEKRIKSPKYGFEVNFKNYYDFSIRKKSIKNKTNI